MMSDDTIPRPKEWFGVRHVQIVLIFLGLMVTFMNRINLSEGLVAMTDSTSQVETIYLTIAQKSALSGAFFWGYAVANIPGGMLAKRTGPIKMLALCMLLSAAISCILPIVALKTGFYGLYVCRMLEGLAQGPIYPSVHMHMGKWAVPRERGILMSITYGGAQVGSVVMMISGGSLADSAGGWPFIFYTSGICGVAWAILCLYIGADSPAVHKTISKEERNYIECSFEGCTEGSEKMTIPWLSFVKSAPVWAILAAHVGFSWGFWSLITLTPTFLDGVFDFDMKKNGILSSLPYIAMFTMTLIFSPIADYLHQRGIHTEVLRKVMNSIAFWGSGLALIALGFLSDSAESTIICLIFASAPFGSVYVGFMGNHIDLSPNFSGILMGITNGLSNLASIAGPSAAGIIVSDESNQDEWKIFFLISGLVMIVANLIFIIFGAGSVQTWNEGRVTGQPELSQKPKSRRSSSIIGPELF